jgi:hypothetical protein
MENKIHPIPQTSSAGPTGFGLFIKISGAIYRREPASTFSACKLSNSVDINKNTIYIEVGTYSCYSEINYFNFV